MIDERAVIIHTGSGRQIEDCVQYCNKTNSILLELSTGTKINELCINSTIIICPNTAIPVLKIMMMLNEYGKIFNKENIKIIESHQSSKTTIAGTAVDIANSLNYKINNIDSIRNTDYQNNAIGIPKDFLDLHAYHKIVINDDDCEVVIETKVLGHKAYVSGVKIILECLQNKELEKRQYNIIELIKNGWL